MEPKTTPRTRGNIVVQVVLGFFTFLALASSTFLIQRFLYPPPVYHDYSGDPVTEVMDVVLYSRLVAYAPAWCREEICPAGSPFRFTRKQLDAMLSVTLPDGSTAPEMELRPLAGGETFRLSQYRKVKPVVLAFGSFTCDRFQGSIPALNKLYQQYKDRMAFVFVAVPEAGHTIPRFEFLLSDDLRNLATKERSGARRMHIEQARQKAGLLIPGYFDPPDYQVCQAYRAWPSRLIVVGAEGRITNDFGIPVPQLWPIEKVKESLERLAQSGPH